MTCRCSADPTFGADRRSRRTATELIEDVGRRHDADDSSVLEHGEAADRATAHEVRCLPDRRRRLGGHHLPRHEISDRSSLAHRDAASPTEVAIRQNAYDALAIHHHEVAQAPRPHHGPCAVCVFAGGRHDHSGIHDLGDSHARESCRVDAIAFAQRLLLRESSSRADTIATLARGTTRLIALRSAGCDKVDVEAADRHGLTVVRVPEPLGSDQRSKAASRGDAGSGTASSKRCRRARARTGEAEPSVPYRRLSAPREAPRCARYRA